MIQLTAWAAFETPNIVVIEVDGEAYEIPPDEADRLANELTTAANQARKGGTNS